MGNQCNCIKEIKKTESDSQTYYQVNLTSVKYPISRFHLSSSRSSLKTPKILDDELPSSPFESDSVEDFNDCDTVESHNFFKEGHDNIIIEGYLYKFTPGLSSNFQKRYVQVSNRAFRYFKDKTAVVASKPLVAFRHSILQQVVPYKVNKESYLKKGARISKSKLEHKLFANMFEFQLNEKYEDNIGQRDCESNSIHDVPKSYKTSQSNIKNSKCFDQNISLNTQNESILTTSTAVTKFKSNKTKISKSHGIAIRDTITNSEQSQHLKTQDMLGKEFGCLHSQTWTNRQIDWYNSERRFIFASTSKIETELWVNLINAKVQVRVQQVDVNVNYEQKDGFLSVNQLGFNQDLFKNDYQHSTSTQQLKILDLFCVDDIEKKEQAILAVVKNEINIEALE